MIKTWQQRCEEHPDHQQGIVTQQMIQDRMQEEIDELRQALAQPEPTVEDNSQNWKGMDGAVAWHLIDRHADNWADIGKMMDEWLKANQAQPEQEPVTGMFEEKLPDQNPPPWVRHYNACLPTSVKCNAIKYTAPPKREWVGLTDEDRSDLITQHHGWNEFGIAIEAKLKEKNT